MFYYLMIAFFVFIGIVAHIAFAHIADSLLEDSDSTGWYKSSYRKYLLIPGISELVLVLIITTVTGVVAYTYAADLFKDFQD